MANWTFHRGRVWPRSLYEPSDPTPPGVCPLCGGSGVVPEQIDEDRFEVIGTCPICRVFCPTCRSWVMRKGHQCKTP